MRSLKTFGCFNQILAAAFWLMATGAAAQTTELTFYYPVAVGGSLTKIFDQLAADFEAENPGIKVKPVYSGTYPDTLAKALTASKAGKAPAGSVLTATDIYTLIDEDAIVPFDQFVTSDADRKWLDSFFPTLMQNSRAGGKTWGIPFQRGTMVMFWNKEAFKAAGLDPEHAPGNWEELVAIAKILTKRDANGNVTQWGLEIPSASYTNWYFAGLTTPNDTVLMNPEGTRTFFDSKEAIEALSFWVDLGYKHKVSPQGTVDPGTTPKDFFDGKAAIVWLSTGNLTNVRATAKFDFGVAPLPRNKRAGGPHSGGNFYIFKNASKAEQAAALKFIKWATTPERAAKWSMDTGYIAVRPDAYATTAMKQYTAGFPAALVGRDQLPNTVAELTTHDGPRVTKVLIDALQAALTGQKSPDAALHDAQRESDRLLRSYQK
jgi:sn-glycerol 3-phosphate transport system substrate-binding protein